MARAASSRTWRVPWRGVLLGPALALLATAATLVMDRETGILPMLKLADRVRQATERVLTLEAERARLIAQVRGLRSDPLHIESVARRQLGMVRPHELVMRFESSDPRTD